MFIDTHCHLNIKTEAGFLTDEEILQIIIRAKEAGVEKMIVVGDELESSNKAIEIAQKHEGIYAAVGVHPEYAEKMQNSNCKIQNGEEKNQALVALQELILADSVVAIGETGIDKTILNEGQSTAFATQIKLAIENKKALIVHSRRAVHETLTVLRENWNVSLAKKSVFHCCEAEEELLNFAKEHKMFVGVDGDISWSKRKQRFIKEVPLEMLVLETDSPFLLPESLKGKEIQNEPKNIPIIAGIVANVKNVSVEVVEKQTTENAKMLFNLGGTRRYPPRMP